MGCPTEYDYIAHKPQGCSVCPRYMDDCDGNEEQWEVEENVNKK